MRVIFQRHWQQKIGQKLFADENSSVVVKCVVTRVLGLKYSPISKRVITLTLDTATNNQFDAKHIKSKLLALGNGLFNVGIVELITGMSPFTVFTISIYLFEDHRVYLSVSSSIDCSNSKLVYNLPTLFQLSASSGTKAFTDATNSLSRLLSLIPK